MAPESRLRSRVLPLVLAPLMVLNVGLAACGADGDDGGTYATADETGMGPDTGAGDDGWSGDSGADDGTGTGTGTGPGSKFDVGTDDGGEPLTPCEQAAEARLNIGCEFFAVDMPNHIVNSLFGVAVSNPSADEATEIRVYDANGGPEQLLMTEQVGPREIASLHLAGKLNAQTKGYYPESAGAIDSAVVEGRAFRIETDLPVVVTQFNPMSLAGAFSGDASLLLPIAAWSTEYLGMAWNRGHGVGSNLVVVAAEDDTVVTFTLPEASAPGQNLPAIPAGVPTEVKLDRYDFVQLATGLAYYANSDLEVDLSGARVESNKPVALLGGHTCGNVPDPSIFACDHLEEQILPLEAWGKHYIAARNPPRMGERMLWRVLGSVDGTVVDFDPPVSIGAQAIVDEGDFVQFESSGDFEVISDQPVLVVGYMIGSQLANALGDPYMVQMIPVEQFQDDYVFLVDSSFEEDFVKYTRPAGASIELECLGVIPENKWTPVGNSGFETAVVSINPGEGACKPGTNSTYGSAPFGIYISGQAYTASYAYPGGGGVLSINPPQG